MTRAAAGLSLVIGIALAGCARSHTLDEGGVRRSEDEASCVPGASTTVACGEGCGLGACTGDPVLAVCEGSVPVGSCLDTGRALAQNDDSCGLCSQVTFTCPASGRIVVATRPFGDRPYTCDWDVR